MPNFVNKNGTLVGTEFKEIPLKWKLLIKSNLMKLKIFIWS